MKNGLQEMGKILRFTEKLKTNDVRESILSICFAKGNWNLNIFYPSMNASRWISADGYVFKLFKKVITLDK